MPWIHRGQIGLIALGLCGCEANGQRSPAKELPTDVPSYPECVYEQRPAEPDEVATASETSAIALRDVVDGVYSGIAVWHGGLETSMTLTVRVLPDEAQIRVPKASSNPYCRSALLPYGEVDVAIGEHSASELSFGYVMLDRYHFGGLPTIPDSLIPVPIREEFGEDPGTGFKVRFSMEAVAPEGMHGNIAMFGTGGNGAVAEFKLPRG